MNHRPDTAAETSANHLLPPCLLTLSDGQKIRVRSTVPADYAAISQLIQDNFSRSENYAELSAAARTAYLEANSLSGVREVCEHQDNVVSLVAIAEATKSTVGFALYRRSRHLLTGEEVAEGKRLQVSLAHKSKGLGNQLLTVVRHLLRSQGFTKVVGYTSGASFSFFEKQGRQRLLTLDNPALAKHGIKAEATYMEYLL